MDRRLLHGPVARLRCLRRRSPDKRWLSASHRKLVVPRFRAILTIQRNSIWVAPSFSPRLVVGASHLPTERRLPLWRRRGVRKALGLHSVPGVNLRRQTSVLCLAASVSLQRKELENAAL